MDSIERAVLELRASVGVAGVGANRAALVLLLGHLCERFAVQRGAVTAPYLYEPEGGKATLVLPHGISANQYEDIVLHEALHVVFSGCYPGIGLGPCTRNGCRTETRDEAAIRRAARAWRLPANCLGDYTDEELADLTGLSLADVRLRRHESLGY
jgi:hypothetical protein